MKITTSLLSAASALVVMTGAVSAADLPSKKAAPVEYVRVCSVHGAGFFYIPGSDTCIKLSGRVRAEFGYYQPRGSYNPAINLAANPAKDEAFYSPNFVYGRDRDATGFQANGRLNVDVRTSTEWGLLRAFFRYDFTINSGIYTSAAINGKNEGTNAGLDKAFIQWAGLTAGRATSFFDFYANDLNFQSIAGADHTVNLFAYTATFGSGFSASLSIEDRTDSDSGISWGLPVGLSNVIDGKAYPFAWTGTSEIPNGGTRMPDIVANLRVDQAWGSAQLSGALHQVRYGALAGDVVPGGFGSYLNDLSAGFAPCFDGQTPGLCSATSLDTDYGYAIQGGVKINLPMLAAGDVLWLQAAYAKGATTYLGPVGISLFSAQGYAPDAWVFPTFNSSGEFNGGVNSELTSGWNLTAAVLHYWTPTIRQALFGSYLDISNPNSNAYYTNWNADGTGAFVAYGAQDVKVWQIGSNLIWSPVADFDIGVEVGYINTDAGNVPTNQVTLNGGNSYWATSGSQNQFYTRLRIERNF